MNIKSKAKILLGIFMLSGVLTQATNFCAIGEESENLGSYFTGVEDSEDRVLVLPDNSRENCVMSIGDIYKRLRQLPDSYSRINFMEKMTKQNVATPEEIEAECCRRVDAGFYHAEYARSSSPSPQEMHDELKPEVIREQLFFSCDEHGNTLLHLAVINGDIDIFMDIKNFSSELSRYLYLSNLDVQNAEGETPLHLAIIYGHFALVKCILEEISQSTCRLRNSSGKSFVYRSVHALEMEDKNGFIPYELAKLSTSYNMVDFVQCHLGVGSGDVGCKKFFDFYRSNRILDMFESAESPQRDRIERRNRTSNIVESPQSDDSDLD